MESQIESLIEEYEAECEAKDKPPTPFGFVLFSWKEIEK